MPWEATRLKPAIIGHRGARAVAPENTLPSLDAAIAAGADAVEFDVRRGVEGELVLAHRRIDARRGRPVPLDAALSHLTEPSRSRVGLVIDVKQRGIEAELVSALRSAKVIDRAVVCAREVALLQGLGEADPALPRAWSLKRARHAAAADLGTAPRDVDATVAVALEKGIAELVTVHRSLITPGLVEAVRAKAGQVLAWGIRSLDQGRELAGLGVDALIVDDPARFRGLP